MTGAALLRRLWVWASRAEAEIGDRLVLAVALAHAKSEREADLVVAYFEARQALPPAGAVSVAPSAPGALSLGDERPS